MIILYNKDCQMSNRLLLAAHCIASGIEYNQDVVLATFGDLAEYYECRLTKSNILVRIKRENRFIGKCLRELRYRLNVYETTRVINYTRKLPELNQKLKKELARTHWIYNWYYRNYEALIKHQGDIRAFFTVKAGVVEKAEHFYKMIKERNNCLVAVHIRRGDYETWNQGKYFYSLEQYSQWIEQLEVDFNKHHISPCFILFSNVKLPEEICRKKNVIISNLSALEDQYLMGKCDYIVGPPSTFSWWAAFMGCKPYCVLKDKMQELNVDSFSIGIDKEYSIAYMGEKNDKE